MPNGATVVVDGREIYYESHGVDGSSQPPLVLLHGGVGAHEMFAPLIPVLGKDRRLVAIDLQGHGRTPDANRPLRFESMADDIAGVVAKLHLAPADLVGTR